ncbi:MAG: hypothetical protein L0H63_10965 [Nitrococcus sp.]|nr:hypothetical protein [Nitrococcus sp.]
MELKRATGSTSAQRRVEARIGQLLGEAVRGGNADEQLDLRMSKSLGRAADGHDFRLLARGFECLEDEEWRRSRRALVSVVRNKLGLRAPRRARSRSPPMPRKPPTVTTGNRLPRAPRASGWRSRHGLGQLGQRGRSGRPVKRAQRRSASQEVARVYGIKS